MRYYHTDNASRAVRAGGFEFQFEPTELRAGAWSGLLAVADESAQAALISLIFEGGPIQEITAEEFEAQKKKTSGVPGSQRWREPSAPLNPRASAAPAAVEPPPPAPSSTDIEIKFAEAAPLDELAEQPEQVKTKKPRKK